MFAADAIMRVNPATGPAAGGNNRRSQITDANKAEIRTALDTYPKRFLVV